ncbi:MAG: nucleoside-diphosphate sugar epimerase/dehydratase [Bacillota bacterium]
MTAKARRIAALALLDAVAVAISLVASYALRFDGEIPARYAAQIPWAGAVAVTVRLGLLAVMGLYGRVWAYASLPELFTIASATGMGTVGMWLLNVFYRPFVVPRSVIIVEWLLSTAAIGGIRILLRVRANWIKARLAEGHAYNGESQRRLLIVGAGDAGAMAVREIQHSTTWQIVGFIDDDPGKWGNRVYGLPVLGGRRRIPEVVKRYGVTEILIAMPSVSRQVIRELVDVCQATKVPVRTLPALYELIDGRVTVNSIREIRIEDLLGREPVQVDVEGIAAYLRGKRVLVTGAGGSIGSEICRQVARFGPDQVVMIGRGEDSLVRAFRKLAQLYPSVAWKHQVVNIWDRDGLLALFEALCPQVVFHAAAHKHVPAMEDAPREATINNVFGTLHVLEACEAAGVERCVVISTDKAADPVSAMGASKRVGELLVQVAARGQLTELVDVRDLLGPGWPVGDGVGKSIGRLVPAFREAAATTDSSTHGERPIYVAVRFGNVLGSRGSVVEVFREALAEGRDLEVTHPDMRRYFMTVQEAVALVIQAGGMGSGGEVFVLDMGEPVRVVDLARDMIRLSGLQPDVDVRIRFTNPRPGEKLTEQLIGDGERVVPTAHPKVFRIEGPSVDADTLAFQIRRLGEAIQRRATKEELRQALLDAARLPVKQVTVKGGTPVSAPDGMDRL